jgi:hypothetical protein
LGTAAPVVNDKNGTGRADFGHYSHLFYTPFAQAGATLCGSCLSPSVSGWELGEGVDDKNQEVIPMAQPTNPGKSKAGKKQKKEEKKKKKQPPATPKQ